MKIISFLLILLMLCPVLWASIDFDEGDDLLYCGDVQGPQSAYSASAWIKPNDVSGADLIIGMWEGGVLDHYTQFFRNGSAIHGRINQSASVHIGRNTGSSVISAGVWTHVAMTWSGGTTNSAIKIYVDGVQSDTTDDGAGSFTAPSAGNVLRFLGCQGAVTTNCGGNGWGGQLSDVAQWSSTLSDSNILQIASSRIKRIPLQISPSTLFSYWPLNEQPDGTSADGDSFTNFGSNGVACTGVDGTGNTGLTAKAEEALSYS